ncbi:hypothetical protein TeGR_g10310, partial [Tetraparma gracilis]
PPPSHPPPRGVSFDPLGKFLVSCSDAPSVNIWSTSDFSLEHSKTTSNSDLFEALAAGAEPSLAAQTFVRRLDWAPDGSSCILPCCLSKAKPIAATMIRNTWQTGNHGSQASANLLGHKKAVVVVRYNPRMWRQPASREHTLIVAVGDKKGYLSVWQAGKTKPIFRSQVSEQQQTITDLAWSRCGYILAVSTLDGFVTAVKFDPDEIGVPLSDAEATKVLESKGWTGGASTDLAESAYQLGMEKQHAATSLQNKAFNSSTMAAGPVVGSEARTPAETLAKQKVTTKKGRKKIAPVLVRVSGDVALDPSTAGVGAGENLADNGQRPPPAPAAPAVPAAPAAPPAPKPPPAPPAPSSPAPKNQAAAAAATEKNSATPTTVAETVRKHAAAATAEQEQSKKKRKTTKASSSKASASAAAAANADAATASPSASSSSSAPPPPLLPVTVNPTLTIELVPAPASSSTPSPAAPTPPLLATVTNDAASHSATVRVSSGATSVFADALKSAAVSALCACESLFAVGTEAGEILLWRSEAGRGFKLSGEGGAARAMPCIAVGGGGVSSLQLYQFKGEGGRVEIRLMALLGDGTLVVWDLVKKVQVVRISVASAVQTMHGGNNKAAKGGGAKALPTVSRSFLDMSSSSLEPMIIVLLQQTGNPGGALQGFYYEPGMEAWLRVSDGRFAASDFYSDSTLRSRMGGGGGGPAAASVLSKVDSYVGKGVSLTPAAVFASSGSTTAAGKAAHHALNRSYCEDKMACAVALRCGEDWRYWFGEFCRFLADAGDEAAFRSVVAELMDGTWEGVGEEGGGVRGWWRGGADAFGFGRVGLLKEVVLGAMTTNRSLQGLVGEVSAKLELVEGLEDVEMT